MPGPGLEKGELGDGLEGILGAEKLLLPRLPKELPPPARAHAVDSIKPAIRMSNMDMIGITKDNFFCLFISDFPPDRFSHHGGPR